MILLTLQSLENCEDALSRAKIIKKSTASQIYVSQVQSLTYPSEWLKKFCGSCLLGTDIVMAADHHSLEKATN